MPSERSINPAQAHRKAEKAKALKKSKAQLASQRAEKLARRNPARLERQIEALADEERSAGSLRPKDKQTLEQLRRDLQAIRKARERLGVGSGGDGDGDKDGGGGGGGGWRDEKKRKWDGEDLDRERRRGRRRRERGEFGGRDDNDNEDDDEESDSGFSTDKSVRRIPMPRDTPPPIPAAARRWRRSRANHWRDGFPGEGQKGEEKKEKEKEKEKEKGQDSATDHVQRNGKEGSTAQAKTVYEAAPAVRDLRKEATSKFVPSVVKSKLDLAQGKGRLLEENEVASLSRSGYIKNAGEDTIMNDTDKYPVNLEDEEKRFERELDNIMDSQQASKTATVEDVEDDQQ